MDTILDASDALPSDVRACLAEYRPVLLSAAQAEAALPILRRLVATVPPVAS